MSDRPASKFLRHGPFEVPLPPDSGKPDATKSRSRHRPVDMVEITTRLARRWKHLAVALALLFLACLWFRDRIFASYGASRLRVKHPFRPVLNSLHLDEETCNAVFPGLTKDIDDMVALGPFKLKQARDMGPLQAKLKDGQVESTVSSPFRSLIFRPANAFANPAIHSPYGRQRVHLSWNAGCKPPPSPLEKASVRPCYVYV